LTEKFAILTIISIGL